MARVAPGRGYLLCKLFKILDCHLVRHTMVNPVNVEQNELFAVFAIPGKSNFLSILGCFIPSPSGTMRGFNRKTQTANRCCKILCHCLFLYREPARAVEINIDFESKDTTFFRKTKTFTLIFSLFLKKVAFCRKEYRRNPVYLYA